MSRLGGVRSGFSFALLKSSSNFFDNTSLFCFSASKLFRNFSSRRSPAPFNFSPSAARSSIGFGFSGTVCAITTRVAGSTFKTAWQHGQVTSNIPLAIGLYGSRCADKQNRVRRRQIAGEQGFATGPGEALVKDVEVSWKVLGEVTG